MKDSWLSSTLRAVFPPSDQRMRKLSEVAARIDRRTTTMADAIEKVSRSLDA